MLWAEKLISSESLSYYGEILVPIVQD